MYAPTCKSYCSGAGGMDLGLLQGGMNVIQSLEIDKNCIKTLYLNFSHDIIYTDFKDILVKDQPGSDVIVCTYPCNHYSNIADIHGTRTGDELFLHFLRHIAVERPECYIVENVPGMKKFKVVMEALTKLPDYYVHVFCPVDANNWLPQKRERLILIATKKPFNIEPPSVSRKLKLSDIIEKEANVNVPDYVYKRLEGKYRDKPIVSDPLKSDSLAPCCVAHYAKDRSTRLVKDKNYPNGVRPYTVREYARLQGFPDSFVFAGNQADQYKQIGNAVAPPMARWICVQIMKYFN